MAVSSRNQLTTLYKQFSDLSNDLTDYYAILGVAKDASQTRDSFSLSPACQKISS